MQVLLHILVSLGSIPEGLTAIAVSVDIACSVAFTAALLVIRRLEKVIVSQSYSCIDACMNITRMCRSEFRSRR